MKAATRNYKPNLAQRLVNGNYNKIIAIIIVIDLILIALTK